MKTHYKNLLNDNKEALDLHAEAKAFVQRTAQSNPNTARQEFEAEAREELTEAVVQSLARRAEALVKKALAQSGNDWEKAARSLAISNVILRDVITNTPKEQGTKQKKTKPGGRPSDEWGPDGCGKFVVKVLVDHDREKVRESGGAPPKAKDSIARTYDLKRKRKQDENRIDNLASRLSEAESRLKKQKKNSET